jgi:hypothetical protein
VSLLPTMKVRRSVLEAALALKAEYGSRAVAVAEERRDGGWRARDTTGAFWNAVKIHLQGTKGQPWRRPYIVEDAGRAGRRFPGPARNQWRRTPGLISELGTRTVRLSLTGAIPCTKRAYGQEWCWISPPRAGGS